MIDDKVQIVLNALGNETTPSYVSFESDVIIAGNIVKNRAQKNPENTIFDVLYLIGRKFNDQLV